MHDGICQRCEDHSPEFDRAVAAVDYAGPWPQLIARLKFHDASALCTPLAMMLSQAVLQRQAQADLILPIPLSPQRLRERGYNQSWLLARQLGQQLGVRARHDILVRHRHTPRLMTLSAEARQREIEQAFSLHPTTQQAVRGRDIALVDDVMTTGATLNACAHILQTAGARSVQAWVVARTPFCTFDQ